MKLSDVFWVQVVVCSASASGKWLESRDGCHFLLWLCGFVQTDPYSIHFDLLVVLPSF